ncbi:hypothetical protein [Actinacidiphila sp. bgisy167]|uniref:hypothetical protein n=1 Tax=Actinacidiphila sp. bgisy167 TaxID=3413797 RepID=UPI003D75C326
MLAEQVHGASSLVTGLQHSMYAVNHHGSVLWVDAHTGTRLQRPDVSLFVASIDLDPDGRLLAPTQDVLAMGWGGERFQSLLPNSELLRALEAGSSGPAERSDQRQVDHDTRTRRVARYDDLGLDPRVPHVQEAVPDESMSSANSEAGRSDARLDDAEEEPSLIGGAFVPLELDPENGNVIIPNDLGPVIHEAGSLTGTQGRVSDVSSTSSASSEAGRSDARLDDAEEEPSLIEETAVHREADAGSGAVIVHDHLVPGARVTSDSSSGEMVTEVSLTPPGVREAGRSDAPLDVAEATSLIEETFAPAEAVSAEEPPADVIPEGLKPTEATDVQQPPKPEVVPPWYVGHDNAGMLGEFAVKDVTVSAITAANEAWAEEVVAALPSTVSDAARAALLELIAVDDPLDWYDLLVEGRTVEAGGRVLWLRPVLVDVKPAKPSVANAENMYGVQWSSTSAAEKNSHMASRAAETALFSALMLSSAAASAFVIGAPRIAVEAGVERSSASRRNVISGRKLYVTDRASFMSHVKLRVFVDGVEAAVGDRPTPVGLEVEFPSIFTDQGKRDLAPQAEPIQDANRTGTTSASGDLVFAKPRMSGEVLNAVDVTPAVAALHRDLRGAGLDASSVIAISRQVQEQILNERAVRNRHAWLLGGGDVTNPIEVGTFARAELNGFRGYLRAHVTLGAVQLVDVRAGAKTRADLGAGAAQGYGRGGESSAAITFAANVTGVVDPLLHNGLVKGVAPFVGLTLGSSRRWNSTLTDSGLNHTVLVARGAMARYKVTLAFSLTWTSGTHPSLKPTTVEVPAELGVPWRDGKAAAEFERRVLGQIASPVVRQGSGHDLAVQVAAQPNVRALLQVSGVKPTVSVVRPERLQTWQPKPVPGEPLHLVLGGLGFGAAIGLPGSHLVEDYFRATLRSLAGKRANVDWATVERQLGVEFARPVLEGDLDSVLAGKTLDIRVGKQTYKLAVKGTLLTRRDSFTAEDLTVNARAAMTSGLNSSSDDRWAVAVGAGAAARISPAQWFRLQLGAVRLQAKFSGGREQILGGSVTAYRRRENLGDEHPPLVSIRDIVYELTVRSADGRVNERVWLDRPGDLVAEIVTPRAFIPAQPVTQGDLALVGKPAFLRTWPAREEPQIDFSSGSTGLYPAFTAMPALTHLVARVYFDLHGLNWTNDWTRWPQEIVDATRPARLEQYFGLLTDGRGRGLRLPDHDGWETTLNLQMRAYAPRALPLSGAKTEIEHYLKHYSHHGTATLGSTSVGFQAATSAMFRLGSDEGGIVLVDGHDSASHGSSHSSMPGGRIVALAHMDMGVDKGSTREHSGGAIEISRGTYEEKQVAGYRSDPVFRVSVTRRRGSRQETATRFIRVNGTMDLLVPDRRVEDLGLPGKATALATDSSVQDVQPPVENTSPLRPQRTYLGDRLWTTSVWPEVLKADGVVPQIIQRLRGRNILPSEERKESIEHARLRETVEAVFRSEALKSGHQALVGSGFGGWFPITERMGATRYVWINVLVESVHPAHAHRDRDEITLTLRSAGVTEDKEASKRGVSASTGFTVSARAGAHQAATDHQAHGGLDYTRGYVRHAGSSDVSVDKSTQIYRANPKDTSAEFEHQVRFRIQLGMTMKMPQILEPFTRYGYVLYNTVANAMATARKVDTRPQEPTPWTWFDDGSGEGREITGHARFLIPQHLTVPAPAVGPMPTPFARTYGENPRWLRLADTALPAEPDTALVDQIHPWDVPAAGALQRWVRTAARQSGADADLAQSRTGLARPDFTSLSGLAHHVQTSQDMVRANIKDLLQHRYIVDVGGTKVRVGLEIVQAVEFEPTPKMKGRNYRQDNHDAEHGVERSRGVIRGGGLDGGGGGWDSVELARALMDSSDSDSSRIEGGASETFEANREATRKYRYYRIDVRMIARPVKDPAYALSVDVPGGLFASLPATPTPTALAPFLAPAEKPGELTEPPGKLDTVPGGKQEEPLEEPEPASRHDVPPAEEVLVPENSDSAKPGGSQEQPGGHPQHEHLAVQPDASRSGEREAVRDADDAGRHRQLPSNPVVPFVEERVAVPVAKPRMRLPLEVIRHPMRFIAEEITGLDAARVASIQAMEDEAARETALGLAVKQAAEAVRTAIAAVPNRGMVNTDVLLVVPISADLGVWLTISQRLANAIDHRVKAFIGSEATTPVEICPQ